jgi:NAD binding domain of 6-phosphogluconate dehydrogenase
MLPSSPQVKHVYSQIIPVLQKLDAGLTSETLFIDSTTLDVDVAREIASSVVNTGAQMVDAPVSGGTQFVRMFLNTEQIQYPLFRCSWGQGRHFVVHGWRYGKVFPDLTAHSVPHG